MLTKTAKMSQRRTGGFCRQPSPEGRVWEGVTESKVSDYLNEKTGAREAEPVFEWR